MRPVTMIGYLLCLLLFVQFGSAHAPSDITIDLNSQTNVLTVKIKHNVGKVQQHYIKEVHILLNGEEIVKQRFESQSSIESQDVQYTIIDAQEGDEISVTADCNISGKKTKKITVEKAENPLEKQ